MTEPTRSLRDGASVIFNLPNYHVIDAIDLPLGGRRVVVQAYTVDDGCPECGVVSARVHAWWRQRVKDMPHAGRLELVVRDDRGTAWRGREASDEIRRRWRTVRPHDHGLIT